MRTFTEKVKKVFDHSLFHLYFVIFKLRICFIQKCVSFVRSNTARLKGSKTGPRKVRVDKRGAKLDQGEQGKTKMEQNWTKESKGRQRGAKLDQ